MKRTVGLIFLSMVFLYLGWCGYKIVTTPPLVNSLIEEIKSQKGEDQFTLSLSTKSFFPNGKKKDEVLNELKMAGFKIKQSPQKELNGIKGDVYSAVLTVPKNPLQRIFPWHYRIHFGFIFQGDLLVDTDSGAMFITL